jgi:hypothetical protein
LPTDKILSINETTVKLSLLPYETDPSFVTYNEGHISPEKRHCFHNPYSNTTVLMFQLDCNDDKEFNRVYRTTYMECPSILVNLQQFHIARYQHGLHFLKTDNFVPFNNFRTFNTSHAYICQKNLLAMKVASIARKVKIDSKMLSITLFLLCTLYNWYYNSFYVNWIIGWRSKMILMNISIISYRDINVLQGYMLHLQITRCF